MKTFNDWMFMTGCLLLGTMIFGWVFCELVPWFCGQPDMGQRPEL
jgi:hypothetical protein